MTFRRGTPEWSAIPNASSGVHLAPRGAGAIVDIRFVSTLTAEDEARLAPRVLKALAALLEGVPLSYTVRILTDGGTVFQHSSAVMPAETPRPS
jgi:hypothetical protein